MDARTDAEISRDVAQVAGALLLELRAGYGPIDDKDAANALRKLADRTSHERIMELLSAARPDDAILSEEGKDDAARLDAEGQPMGVLRGIDLRIAPGERVGLVGASGADVVTLGAVITSASADLASGSDQLTLANGTNSLSTSNIESAGRNNSRL